jgi:CRISPR system Cascade subunit CasA
VHGQPGGIAWRDWLSLTLVDPEAGLREPAATVAHWQRRARAVGRRTLRIHAFGYDMDNMKARGWTDTILPAFAVEDEERRALLYTTARSFTEATSLAGTALLGAVKTALFQSPDDAPGDLGKVRLDLWASTERAFYAAVEDVADPALDIDAASDRAEERRRGFVRPLTEAATTVFDRWCPPDGLSVEALRRRVTARYNLLSALGGFSKLGEEICRVLGIAPPGGGRAARAAKPRKSKEKAT